MDIVDIVDIVDILYKVDKVDIVKSYFNSEKIKAFARFDHNWSCFDCVQICRILGSFTVVYYHLRK